MTPNKVDALLFDLGGVVMEIDFNRAYDRWAQYARCETLPLKERFQADRAYERHEIGEIDEADYFAALRTSLGIQISDEQFLDGWNAIFVGEVPGISSVLKRAAARFPLYAFSNTNRVHEAYWSKRFADVMSHFKAVVVSSTIGMRKPDAPAFAHVVELIGAPAGRILFFDDLLDNVLGARACGLQAVHVRTHADVAETVAALIP